MQLASSRRPCTAIQLYSAIHHTPIQRYTVYTLYIIPLVSPCFPLKLAPAAANIEAHMEPLYVALWSKQASGRAHTYS